MNRLDLSLSRSSRREKRSKTYSAFVRHRVEMRNMTADSMDKEFSIALLVQRPFFGTLTLNLASKTRGRRRSAIKVTLVLHLPKVWQQYPS